MFSLERRSLRDNIEIPEGRVPRGQSKALFSAAQRQEKGKWAEMEDRRFPLITRKEFFTELT